MSIRVETELVTAVELIKRLQQELQEERKLRKTSEQEIMLLKTVNREI
jgi:hypothetical protein